MDASAVQIALLLAVVVKSILDYIARPIRSKFPDLDLWWFDYVALVTGVVVAWFAAVNIFTFMPNQVLARILTGCLIGGGAKLINDAYVVAQGGSTASQLLAQRDITAADTAKQPAEVKRKVGW